MNDSYNCNCNMMWITIIIGSIPLLYVLRKYIQGGQFTKNISAHGKVIIVTGANTGIGKKTALDLARRGAKVYMACRDYKRCEKARKDIIKETGNKNIFNRELDLSSLESIRKFVKRFLAEETRLDILINNAGLLTAERTVTKDGFETTMGVNHLGPFLLTNLLLDTLKASAPSRIVNVASIAHTWGKINKDDIQYEISFTKWKAYANSKLANVLFTRELAKRLQGTGVTANSLHPGNIKTDIGRYQPLYLHVLGIPSIFLLKSPMAGAQTTIAVALDPDLENVTGKYFSDCKIKKESQRAQDDEMALWLWNKSEVLTGLITK